MTERPDDFEVVRLILTRQRHLGQPFDAAFEMALAAIPRIDEYPRSMAALDRDLTRAVLGQTRAHWQASYARTPPPPSPHQQNAAQLRSMLAEVAVAA